ncbi:hypothetical protein IEQ44_05490 [Nocardioides sp. Y6]|uniref:Uncharacterized protein n=1 Tax=Nocardioides malaquae TaxID=2773426 RepID=A0ABR9RR99_9ACTN|nr:hypothetical protein [Nocardioides malaquae]MBE7324098.1 hypothetical protein [Nocardioides malaquae]
MSTDAVEAVVRMHGGVKFYRGSAKPARNYVEKDCARYDDYYLDEGDGIAMRLVADAPPDGEVAVEEKQGMDGDAYESWVAGLVVETGQPKGPAET